MSIDDAVKLILALSVAFFLIGIAWQLMRVLSGIADIIKDARPVMQNIVKITDMATEDYSKIRRIIDTVTGMLTNWQDLLSLPLKYLGKFSRSGKAKSDN